MRDEVVANEGVVMRAAPVGGQLYAGNGQHNDQTANERSVLILRF